MVEILIWSSGLKPKLLGIKPIDLKTFFFFKEKFEDTSFDQKYDIKMVVVFA